MQQLCEVPAVEPAEEGTASAVPRAVQSAEAVRQTGDAEPAADRAPGAGVPPSTQQAAPADSKSCFL